MECLLFGSLEDGRKKKEERKEGRKGDGMKSDFSLQVKDEMRRFWNSSQTEIVFSLSYFNLKPNFTATERETQPDFGLCLGNTNQIFRDVACLLAC